MISDPLPLRTLVESRRAVVLAGSLALFLLTSTPAAYAKKPTPTPTPTTTQAQAATPTSPSPSRDRQEGTAGTTAVWTLTVRNHGDAAASTFSAGTRLPGGCLGPVRTRR